MIDLENGICESDDDFIVTHKPNLVQQKIQPTKKRAGMFEETRPAISLPTKQDESARKRIKNPLVPGSVKLIETLRPWQQEIVDICESPPEDRRVNWICDTVGESGKTKLVMYLIAWYGAAVSRGGKYSDVCNLVYKTDMEKCRIVCFDIPRKLIDAIDYPSLEATKDGLVSNVKFVTGTKLFNAPHVFVFANSMPIFENLSADRWNIIDLNE